MMSNDRRAHSTTAATKREKNSLFFLAQSNDSKLIASHSSKFTSPLNRLDWFICDVGVEKEEMKKNVMRLYSQKQSLEGRHKNETFNDFITARHEWDFLFIIDTWRKTQLELTQKLSKTSLSKVSDALTKLWENLL